MKSGIRGVMSGIIEVNMEQHIKGNNMKLQDSRVSKHRSHDSIATFPHIRLQNVQFYDNNSGDVEQAMMRVFKM